MNKATMTLMILFGLAACSPPANKSANDTAVEAPTDAAESSQAAPEIAVIEYVWHRKGAEYSDEKLADLVIKWNALVDTAGYDINRANILTPHVESDRYDFIWVMTFPSMDVRNAVWDDWMANHAEEWDATIAGIMSYNTEDVYAFKPTVKRQPSVINDDNAFENEFNFCNYNEGYGEQDLADFETQFAAFMDASDATNGANGYYYVMLEPYFEGTEDNPQADYLWLNLWSNGDEKAAGYANYEASDLPQVADAFSTCNRVAFAGQQIR